MRSTMRQTTMSTRVTALEARPSLLLSLLTLLLIAYAWPIWLQHKQFDRITRMEATIQKQTATLNAALDSSPPVKMPGEWEIDFENLEAKIADPNLWPKNTAQAEEFVDNLSQLISVLSPLSEATYFSRLSLVRWAAMAFDSIHRTPDPTESLDDLVEQMRTIADARPEGVVSDLEQRLRETADKVTNRAEMQLIEETIQQARQYLANEDTMLDDSLAPRSNTEEIHAILEIYEDDDQRGAEIGTLRKLLQRHMAIRNATVQAAAIGDQWNKAKDLATSRAAVYATAANILLTEVSTARAILALQDIQEPIYDDLERQIRLAVEEIQENARREYQRWALTEIVRFRNRHEAISDKAAEDARIFSIDSGGWSDERFEEVQDAMISYLLPINPALLDLPVLKRFEREFRGGWNRLDGREEQTGVAIASALTEQRTFHSLKLR